VRALRSSYDLVDDVVTLRTANTLTLRTNAALQAERFAPMLQRSIARRGPQSGNGFVHEASA
jgi:hypothetical protein